MSRKSPRRTRRGSSPVRPRSAHLIERLEQRLLLSTTIHRTALFPEKILINSPADAEFANGVRALVAADLDGDNDLDLLAASAFDNEVSWYENTDGKGTFGPQQILPLSVTLPFTVFAADLDGDNDLDVLSASPIDNTVVWSENLGGGSFGAQQIISSDASVAIAVFAVDLDADDDLDVVAGLAGSSQIVWYENDGSGAFTARPVADDALVVLAIYVADLNGDKSPDVLAALGGDNRFVWYANDGTGTFGPAQTIGAALLPTWVHAADIDGDGDLDVLGASSDDDTIAWYRNDGAGNFELRPAISTTADGATSVTAADLDNDGDLDVLSSSSFDAKIAWYENLDGAGTFGPEQIITTTAADARIVMTADLDADGDQDVASGSSDDSTVAWYPNLGGHFALATTDISPASILDGTSSGLFKIIATHRGRDGDNDVELAAFEFLFEASENVPLSSAEANALIATLKVYLDGNASGAFEPADDTLVATIADLALVDGVQTVPLPDGDLLIRIPFGIPRTYFLVADLTTDASSQVPNGFRVTHLTAGAITSSGEDRETDEPLALEFAPNVTATVVAEPIPEEQNAPPVNHVPGTQTIDEDTVLVFSSANGNAISISDSDAGTGRMITNVEVTLGTLSVTVLGSTSVGGSHSISGPITSINTALATLQFTPPAHFSGLVRLTITTDDQGNSGTGGAMQDIDEILIDVVAVADTPDLAVLPAGGNPGEAIPLSISASLVDTDGSETLSIVISNVPSGATLSAGIDNSDGSWTLTPDELIGLTITTLPGTDDFDLLVTATATEESNGDTASAVETLAVTLDDSAVADTPNLNVLPAVGDEDTAIDLSIDASLVDTDGSETLSILISGVPSGAVLSAGVDNGGGSWTLSSDELIGLSITPPLHSDADFDLTVTATATEISNGDTASASQTLSVTVNAVADVPDLSVEDASGDEGSAMPLDLSASLVDTDGSETLSIVISGVPSGAVLSAGVDSGGGVWTLTPDQLAGLTITVADNITTSLTVTAISTETDGGSMASNGQVLSLTVLNVNPTPSISGPDDVLIGHSISFNFGATDASSVDNAAGFTYLIDWGDGSPLVTIPMTAGNGAGASMSHTYANLGVYTVTLQATDKDGGTGTATHDVTVSGVKLIADLIDPRKQSLVIGGTSGNDFIHIKSFSGAGKIQVLINGVSHGIYTNLASFIAYGQAGHDTILVDRLVRQFGFYFGGPGHDQITAGRGNSALIGGAGDDVLTGGESNDILIGGTGGDNLRGGSKDDLLIGGNTSYDNDLVALAAILAEWSRPNLDYFGRVANLSNGGGLNGTVVLNASTVFDDNVADMLQGQQGRDWFFASATDTTDQARKEVLNSIT